MFYRGIADIFNTALASLLFRRTRRGIRSTRYAAFCALASALVLGFAIVSSLTTAIAQEKPEQKPATPTASPSPQPKLGTELDGPVIVNTDLITLTVTVTDTYGRYVSGLSKNAFNVFD